MPALFNLSVHLAIGSVLALIARRSLSFRQDVISWPIMLLFAFHAVVAGPSATYLFRFYPQWSMLYAFDPQVFPALTNWVGVLSGAVVLLNLIAAMVGLFATREGIRMDSAVVRQLPLSVAALSFVVGVLIYGERALWVGTYDEYWHDQALLLFTTSPGVLGLLTYGLGVLFLFWVHRRFGEQEPRYI